jgi:hypothetical protein
MTYNNGDFYEGNWVKGKKEGIGNIRYSNGDTYSGKWFNDIKKGKGVMIMNGSEYSGDFTDKMNGKGTIK